MEMLYHVTADDSVIGPVQRDEAHAKEIMHRSGIVFLLRSDGRVLIQHRSPSKEIFPDCHDTSCAFHVTYGESYEDAAERELIEETGVSAPLKYLGKFSHHDIPERQMVAVFSCTSDKQVILDKSEATGGEFRTKEEIDEIVASRKTTPWLRDGWKMARNQI